MTAHDNAQPQTEIGTLQSELAFYKQYTGYLENGEPADEPALECKKCGAYYFHDLGGKSLCGDCLEALADHVDRLQAENLKLWQAYNTLFSTVWIIGDYELTDSTNLREHAEETIKLGRHVIRLVDAIGLEDARDEFRKQLTAGVDEGEAL